MRQCHSDEDSSLKHLTQFVIVCHKIRSENLSEYIIPKSIMLHMKTTSSKSNLTF